MRKIFVITVILLVAGIICLFRVFLLTLGSVLYVYFLPGVIATKRKPFKEKEVYLVCACCGWLIIPWLAALCYVYTSPKSTAMCNDKISSNKSA
jgi:hypothetical protein